MVRRAVLPRCQVINRIKQERNSDLCSYVTQMVRDSFSRARERSAVRVAVLLIFY